MFGLTKEDGRTDAVVEDAMDKDIIIVIMGATGAGKSTFINTLMGEEIATVGKGMRSETKFVQHYHFHHPHHQYAGRRILVVDTPGFDDTTESDEVILERIASWLARSYRDGKKHAGLIYLHDITHRRMAGSKKMNYEVFTKLCGEEAATKVVLATTMWGDVQKEAGENRERELKEDFWSDMYSKGSTIHRVELTKESTLEIIDSVLSHSFDSAVAIQREMVDEQRNFAETEAFLHLKRSRAHQVGVGESEAGKVPKKSLAQRFLGTFFRPGSKSSENT